MVAMPSWPRRSAIGACWPASRGPCTSVRATANLCRPRPGLGRPRGARPRRRDPLPARGAAEVARRLPVTHHADIAASVLPRSCSYHQAAEKLLGRGAGSAGLRMPRSSAHRRRQVMMTVGRRASHFAPRPAEVPRAATRCIVQVWHREVARHFWPLRGCLVSVGSRGTTIPFLPCPCPRPVGARRCDAASRARELWPTRVTP